MSSQEIAKIFLLTAGSLVRVRPGEPISDGDCNWGHGRATGPWGMAWSWARPDPVG